MIELSQRLKELVITSQQQWKDADNFKSSSWRKNRLEETDKLIDKTCNEITSCFLEKYAKRFIPAERLFALSYFLGHGSFISDSAEGTSKEMIEILGVNDFCIMEEEIAHEYLDRMYNACELQIPIDFLMRHLGYISESVTGHSTYKVYNKLKQYIETWKFKREVLS